MRKAAAVLVLGTFVSMISALPGHAQTKARTQGFHFGAALNGSAITIDDEDFGDSESESGPGLSLYGAYNFTPNFGFFIGLAGASIQPEGGSSYGLGHGDIGVRVSLGTSSTVPYVEAAYSGLNVQGDIDGDDVELQGTGITGALGVNFFLSEKLALDINFKYTSGEFNTLKINGQGITTDDGLGVATGRFNIGLAYYPTARRTRSVLRQ